MGSDYGYQVRYALHPDIDEERFSDVLQGLDFRPAAKLLLTEGAPLHESIFQNRQLDHEVRFVDDHYVEISYALICSTQHPAHLKLIATMQEHLRMFSLLDLSYLAEDPDEGNRVFALRGYGAIYRGFWGAITKHYDAALSDERRSVREAVLAGMARIAWLEFIPPLEKAIEREADAQLRADMVDLKSGLQQYGKRGVDQMF